MTEQDVAQYFHLQNKIQTEFREYIAGLIINLLDKHQCETVRVVGYTPYYADGEICYYSIDDYKTQVDGKHVGEFWENDPNPNEDGLTKGCKELEFYDEFTTLINKFPSDWFRDVFGDHNSILFHASLPPETNHYEHD